MILALIAAMGAYAQHDHAAHGAQSSTQQMEPMFKDKAVGTAYSHYTHLKDALVASDRQEVAAASEALVKALHQMKNADKAHAEAAKVAQGGSLDEQRKAFTALSEEMANLVKNSGLSMGEVYLEYCPMAKASWLSSEKEISNPYLGNKMLKCGSVKETIN